MATTPDPDRGVPVKRMQLDASTGKLVVSPKAALFLRGPIPLDWLGSAAALPGKTLHVGIALWWLHGMAKGKPFKLTQKALQTLNVERDAASAALVRLELAGLIRVVRKHGQRPTVSMVVGGVSGASSLTGVLRDPNDGIGLWVSNGLEAVGNFSSIARASVARQGNSASAMMKIVN